MAITNPTPITALPTPPSTVDPVNFDNRADAFLLALPTLRTEVNTISTVNYNNALDAAASATSASGSIALAAAQVILATEQANTSTTQASNANASAIAAAASAGASVWVSGTTYAIGDVRYSVISGRAYRRLTAGAGTTDPSADGTNWKVLDNLPQIVAVTAATWSVVPFTHYVLQFAGQITMNMSTTPAAGDSVWFTVANGRSDNRVYFNGYSHMDVTFATDPYCSLDTNITSMWRLLGTNWNIL